MKKNILVCLFIAGVLFSLALPAFSADLQISMNEADNTLTISNLLGLDIHLVSLQGEERSLLLSAVVPANKTVTVSAAELGGLPQALQHANCIPESVNDLDIPGYVKAEDGMFHVSVEML